jgi:hypothetical protein
LFLHYFHIIICLLLLFFSKTSIFHYEIYFFWSTLPCFHPSNNDHTLLNVPSFPLRFVWWHLINQWIIDKFKFIKRSIDWNIFYIKVLNCTTPFCATMTKWHIQTFEHACVFFWFFKIVKPNKILKKGRI